MQQVNPLYARLRDILRNYSSAQLLNEMLQNADDAGSTQFKVLIDSRTFGNKSLLSPALAHTQGPALLQFDDAEFNAEDYDSIQRVGDGTKMGDPTKTGQFGLGFNSVYHLTDTPCFISGSDFVMFDPHETHLAADQEIPVKATELARSCPDQVAPFEGIFGCDPANGWRTPDRKGTLFRLPLRTREAADRSLIKDGKGGAPTIDDVMETVVEPFLRQINRAAGGGADQTELILHRRLLFLRYIENIEVWVWPKGAKQMKLLASAQIVSDDASARVALQAERTKLMNFVKSAMVQSSPPEHDEYGGAAGSRRYFATMAKLDASAVPRPIFSLRVVVTYPQQFDGSVEEQWLVSMAFGDRDDVGYAAAPRQRIEKLTLMPYGAVAALVARKPAGGGEVELAPPLVGRAYATLPLPITTGLQVHLNGRWEIASDRNSLAPDDAKPRHEWNLRLAGRVCAGAYARLLRELANGFPLAGLELSAAQRGEAVHKLLPPSTIDGAVFGGAAHGTMKRLLQPTHGTWKSFERHGGSFGGQTKVAVVHTTAGEWASAHDALFLHHGQNGDGGAGGDVDVALAIGAMGCAVTDAPTSAFDGFLKAAMSLSVEQPKRLTPATARGWMRSAEGNEALQMHLMLAEPNERRALCRKLLGFAVSDVPRLGVPVVHNPPESDRSYSSVYGNNSIGTGHARSCLDSPQAWSNQNQDKSPWVVIKAGDGEVCVAGLVFQSRRANCGHQRVTKVRVEVSTDDGRTWRTDANADGEYETGCKENDETHRRIEFGGVVLATHVRIHVLAFEKHCSMRCALLLGASAVGIISAIAQRAGEVGAAAQLPWDKASADDRAAILDLISRDVATLGADQLTTLASFPLFSYDDAAAALGASSCGPLGPEARRWTKPEFRSLAAQGGVNEFAADDGSTSRFLSRIPSRAPRASLYSALHIVSMNRSDFYVFVVLREASWRALTDDARADQLIELQRHYETMKDDLITMPDGEQRPFEAFFASAPLFRSDVGDGHPSWLCVTDLLDPSVDLHHAFFPERLPHARLATEATLQWLRRCGMRESLTRSSFTAAAMKVHEQATAAMTRHEALSRALLEEAEQLTSALVTCYTLLADDDAQQGEPPLDAWLDALGDMRLARPFAMPPRVFIEDPTTLPADCGLGATPAELLGMCQARGGHVNTLVPFKGNVVPVESVYTHVLNAACWSRTTVLKLTDARRVPVALVQGLGAQADSTIDHICEHAAFICSVGEETLRKWQGEKRDTWLEGGDRRGRSGTFKQQLEMACYVLLATATPAALQQYLRDRPIVMLASLYTPTFRFINPSIVFVDLNYSAPPYAYTLRDVETSFGRMRLHTLLDCPRTPTLEQVHSWLEDLAARSNGQVLSPNHLRSAGVLADLAGFKLMYSIGSTRIPDRPFPLPDKTGRMRLATHLLVDDAPWLEGRVDKSENGPLNVVHESITERTALRLGARGLSSAVVELPDGPLSPLQPAQIDAELGGGVGADVGRQITVWNENMRSRAFRVSVRRAVQYGRRSSALAAPLGDSDADDVQTRVDELRHAAIVVVAEIRSRFVVQQDDGTQTDVTALDGRYGSDALTVLPNGASSKPTIYLKLSAGGAPEGGGGGANAPPALARQKSGYRALQKIFKRWKPSLATELDRFLGEGAVRDRMLLVELLDCDDVTEMPDMMNRYKIPMGTFEAWIGTRYDEPRDGKPRKLLEGGREMQAYVGEKVLFSSVHLPESLQEEGDAARAVLLLGRLARVVRGQCVVTVTGDDETCTIDPTLLLRPPTREEVVADQRAAAEAAEAQRGESTAAAAAAFAANAARVAQEVPSGRADESPDGAQDSAVALTPPVAPTPPAAPTPAAPSGTDEALWNVMMDGHFAPYELEVSRTIEACFQRNDTEARFSIGDRAYRIDFTSMKQISPKGMKRDVKRMATEGEGDAEANDGMGPEVTRVEYKPAAGWLESELAARRALEARMEARRAAAPVEREAEGMDHVLRKSEAVTMQPVPGSKAGLTVPVSKSIAEGVQVTAAVKSTPGYDLVRVGNFTERVNEPADIAFFHHYPTLHEIYDERRFGRQKLVREVCGALRDLCDLVFYPFDAAKVTLFYEAGAGSRFVRQKLLFNIWPIEKHRAAKKLTDVRTDSYVYAYLYGLLVHKLAHFFDVVHGTRHDFFMTEYRANHDLPWVQLLLARGFDPSQVESEHRGLLWQVVD